MTPFKLRDPASNQKPAIKLFAGTDVMRILNVAGSSGACSSDDVNVA
jgi:hypothetical protein